ncbi:nucleoside phosphorylase [Owenweeksia hongkongensis]|uniref:nucleoside phosphorylase n=1 Tax=Owenweeksia hongkongensis TaxID=253245 RepID=UPI003A8F0F74
MNSSELILNNDGSVYHLSLKPGDVSETIITVGDPDRVSKVSALFDSVDFRMQKREFVTHTGALSGKRLTVISTGIGTDNIDIVINELHSLKVLANDLDKPYTFIRLGTSGAVRPDVKVDSILISSAAIGLDGLLHFYDWNESQDEIDELIAQSEKWKLLPRAYAAMANSELVNRFSPIADKLGVTLTAPGFYAPQGRSVNTPARISDFVGLLGSSTFTGVPITNLEMETAGIYGLASLLGHEAVSISAILASRATGEFSKKPDEVVEMMINRALEVLVG